MGVAFSRERQDLFKVTILMTTILVTLVLVNTLALPNTSTEPVSVNISIAPYVEVAFENPDTDFPLPITSFGSQGLGSASDAATLEFKANTEFELSGSISPPEEAKDHWNWKTYFGETQETGPVGFGAGEYENYYMWVEVSNVRISDEPGWYGEGIVTVTITPS